MKRIIAMCLSLVLSLVCASPALAVENQEYLEKEQQLEALYSELEQTYAKIESLEEELSVYYADYYETYGDMSTWDEETSQIAEGWSDAEWAGYWLGEENCMSGYDWLEQEKESMGMYFPNGVNVQVNGVYLAVEPYVINGVSYLPKDTLLQTLGLDSTETKTVMLNGKECLPIREVAEAIGYDVEWDSWYNLIRVTNWAVLADEIDRDFTILNAILKGSFNSVDQTKTYSSNGTIKLVATLYGDQKDDTATVTVNSSALVSGDATAMDATLTLKTDVKDMEDVVRDFGGQEFLDKATALNNKSIAYRFDANAGKMGVKSNIWKALDIEDLPENQWIGTEFLGDAQTYTAIVNEMMDTTAGSMLVMIVQNSYGSYEDLHEMHMMLALLFGDSAFTSSKSGNTTTYTCKMDMSKLLIRSAQMGLFTAEDIDDVFGGIGTPTLNYQFVATLRGDVLTNISMSGNMKWSSFNLEFDSRQSQTKAHAYIALKGRYIGKLEMTADSTSSVTNQKVPALPNNMMIIE